MSGNIAGHIISFLIRRIQLLERNLISLSVVRPQTLRLTSDIVGDHTVGSVKNILCASIVLLQLDHLRILKMLLEIQNIVDIRTSEFVDGLIIITDHTQILIF